MKYLLKLLDLNLSLKMPDKLVRRNNKEIKRYKALFEKYDIEMGIFEFIGESVDYQYLQDLRPVYIKGEPGYFLSQSDQSLSAFRLITDTVGISFDCNRSHGYGYFKNDFKKKIFTSFKVKLPR